MSCATHRLDGGIALKLDIKDSSGKIIDSMEK